MEWHGLYVAHQQLVQAATIAHDVTLQTPIINEEGASGLQPLRRLKPDSVNALRYRAEGVLRGLTKKAVQEARAQDLKLEVLNCSRLQVPELPIWTFLFVHLEAAAVTGPSVLGYLHHLYTCLQEFFEAHKADAAALKHDKQLTKEARRVKHLRHMPDYLRSSLGASTSVAAHGGQRSVKRRLRPDDDPLKVRFTGIGSWANLQLRDSTNLTLNRHRDAAYRRK